MSKDRTENDDNTSDEIIVVPKPAGVTDAQWAEIKATTTARLDQLVKLMREPTWCTETDQASHAKYHSGDPVSLTATGATYGPETDGQWWAWPVWHRGAFEPYIVLEGPDGNSVEIYSGALADVLSATSTPEAREALAQLVDAVIGSA